MSLSTISDSYMQYFLGLFRLRGFHKEPFKVFVRATEMIVRLIFKSSTIIDTKFGSSAVKFSFKPRGRHLGGRGFFLQRNKIEDLYEFGDRFIKLGDTCIDGGANQGLYSIAFGRYVGSTGRVIAVEPFSYAAEMIAKNAHLNELANVEIEQAALSDHEGEIEIDYSEGVCRASIIRDCGGQKTARVPVTTIDSLVSRHSLSRIDFIKLDIEGAETLALAGGFQTLTQHRPTLCLELTKCQFEEITGILGPLGYQAFRFSANGSLDQIDALEGPALNVFLLSNLQNSDR